MRSASSEPVTDRVQTATLLRSASLSTSPRPSYLKAAQEKRKNVRRKREFNPLEKAAVASPRPPEKVSDKETVLTLPASGQRISLFRQQVHAWSNKDTEKAGAHAKRTSFPVISNTQGN
ncbi:MAG: hypothetical protein K0U37_00140 [Gammaproteobacteria bacterium]|nr:hypothetical protein [Gammaproteobacteria bacterium]